MDEFERLEAGLSRDLMPKKSLGRQAADTLLGCFIQRDEEDGTNEDLSFGAKDESLTSVLFSSTQAIMDVVSSFTTGISSLFWATKPQPVQPVIEAPLEIIISGPSVSLPESPTMIEIQSENCDAKIAESSSVATVDDYDGSGFWEDHLDDSISESESFYGIDSYIDTSKDGDIVMQPITKKEPSEKKAKAKVRFEPIVDFMNSAVINDRVVIKAYLQSGHFDINVRDKIGYTLLHYASAHGHTDLVKYLLDHGADVNLPEPEGWTALHFAAIADQYKVCKVLIERGANIECPNSEGTKPVELTGEAKIKKLFDEALKKKLSAKKVQALYDWDAEDEQELSMKRGQTLKVKERLDDAWWRVQNEAKQIGLVPRIFIQ